MSDVSRRRVGRVDDLHGEIDRLEAEVERLTRVTEVIMATSDLDHERLGNLLRIVMDERNERDATIERVRAIIDGPHAALVVDRVRTALEPRCTCSGITSQHGVDRSFGLDKVWRCDECDRIWEPSS